MRESRSLSIENYFNEANLESSRNNQCCGFGMFIPDPEISSIPGPRSNEKKIEEEVNIFLYYLFCSHKFT
jgi:hypothetical protein